VGVNEGQPLSKPAIRVVPAEQPEPFASKARNQRCRHRRLIGRGLGATLQD
jgi:hypothetical protein